jgi:hypothetical protein
VDDHGLGRDIDPVDKQEFRGLDDLLFRGPGVVRRDLDVPLMQEPRDDIGRDVQGRQFRGESMPEQMRGEMEALALGRQHDAVGRRLSPGTPRQPTSP